MSAEAQDTLVRRLRDKIEENADDIMHIEESELEGADVVVVSYGITSRVARAAVDQARRQGYRVGEMRLVTVWPFPLERIRALAARVAAFVVPEINLGQIVREVERAAAGRAAVIPVSHAGGWVHDPQDIYDAIRFGLRARPRAGSQRGDVAKGTEP
jgi:2-oxoglutarate ferredoxin oxidoreductase subunit alpha